MDTKPRELYLYLVYVGNLSSFYDALLQSAYEYIQINNFGGINATQGFVVLGKLDVTKTNASISERRIWSEHVIDWNSLVIPPQLNYCGDSLPCPGCGSASQMLDRGCRCTKEQALD
jgi:hypothetical protein